MTWKMAIQTFLAAALLNQFPWRDLRLYWAQYTTNIANILNTKDNCEIALHKRTGSGFKQYEYPINIYRDSQYTDKTTMRWNDP